MQLRIDTEDVRTAHEGIINDKASEFVADLEDSLDGLSRTEQIQLFDRLSAVVGSKDSFTAFVNGTYAQDSTGSPAKELIVGSSTKSPESTVLDTVMASPALPDGVKMAFSRMITPGVSDYIKTEPDGTPTEIISLRKEVVTVTNQRDTAMDDLLNEKDPNKSGSMAAQLKEAQEASATPADMVKKDDLKPLIEEAKTAASDLTTSIGSNTVKGKPEVVAKINDAIAALG